VNDRTPPHPVNTPNVEERMVQWNAPHFVGVLAAAAAAAAAAGKE